MALFGSKKNTEKIVKAPKASKPAKAEKVVAIRESAAPTFTRDIILRPRITEKSGVMNEAMNVYTFEVVKLATKDSVAKAIKAAYKVTPLKVRIINLPAKSVMVKGRPGMHSAVKKALVFLKKGDKIEFA